MKTRLVITIAFLVLRSADPNVVASSELMSPGEWDFTPLLYYELVVTGQITQARSGDVSSNDLFSLAAEWETKGPQFRTQVKYVTLNVSHVLRGPAVNDVTIVVPLPMFLKEYDTRYVVGDTVLMCAIYHRRLGSYYLKDPHGKYIFRNGEWACEGIPEGTRAFSDEALRAKVKEMDIETVTKDAELIVIGTVKSYTKERITVEDSIKATLVTVNLQVDEVKKGVLDGGEVVVKMMPRGAYRPAWRKLVPKQMAVGQKWLAFLKRNEIGWYPFAGMNGLLRIEGEELIYDERVPFWHTKKEIEQLIMRDANQ